MNYVNYWLYQLGDVLPVDGDALPVSGIALARLALDDGVRYALVLSDSLAAVGDPQFEVINIVGLAGGSYTLQRGQEGTDPREWPAGTLIMAPLTVAGIEELKSSVGAPGASAYEVAVANGFVGTEAEWLASLRGEDGEPGANGDSGASAYDVAVANGFAGTEAEWLASLEGASGDPGASGASAYEVAVANGFLGTEAEWLASLQGEDGAGLDIIDELASSGDLPLTGSPGDGYLISGDLWLWVDGAWLNTGPIRGPAGKSAYELAVANGFAGTESEWLSSLSGAPGDTGAAGASAYEVAVANGFEGTEAEWLASLDGPPGEKGDPADPLLGLPSRTVSGAASTVTPADAGYLIDCTSDDPVLLTISAEAAGTWSATGLMPIFHVMQRGVGAVTLTGSGFSLVLHPDDTAVLNGPGAVASVLRVGPDIWRPFGDLVRA